MTFVGSVHNPKIMLCMLIKVLCGDSIATRRRLPSGVLALVVQDHPNRAGRNLRGIRPFIASQRTPAYGAVTSY
jgi:hypothetical protein